MNGHTYTREQDNFICDNFENVGECVTKFNLKFGTSLSYSAIKTHANRKLKIKSGLRPWTKEMNKTLSEILREHPYKQATEIFNSQFDTKFTLKQIQDHCVRSGIKRNFAAHMHRIDRIIAQNIDKSYGEIKEIIREQAGKNYISETSICVRANKQGLRRPHRVWSIHDERTIDGVKVTFSEYVTFIGNRWHRLSPILRPIALQATKLQVATRIND